MKDLGAKLSQVFSCIEQDKVEQNPVEILRYLQNYLVIGRKLEIQDVSLANIGETNYIMVDRSNILETGFEELETHSNKFITLEVQFYDEQAQDYGGPRKEFFLLMLRRIKEKYFDNGLMNAFKSDYRKIGSLFGLSILQNGKIPNFLSEEVLQELFHGSPDEGSCMFELRKGMDELGIIQVGKKYPLFLHLFRKGTECKLKLKNLTQLLKPTFDEEGTNSRQFQNKGYKLFVKYLREAASGRRKDVTLEKVLIFTTGVDEEPVLGFELHPSLVFVDEDENRFLPTSSTCINQLKLPVGSSSNELPSEEALFELYDFAFLNTHFGLV